MSNFKNKKILITGGLGFLGSNLAIELVRQGASVEVFDSLIKNFGGNKFNVEPVKKDLKITIGDLRDTAKILKAVRSKDIIYNLAGNLSHIDSMTNPFMDLDLNCRAQLCLLEAVRKRNSHVKIIFAGTRNQYGRALYLPVDEKHIQEPTDINGINSIAAEKYHFLYGKIYGASIVSLRMTNIFGPRHQMKHPRQGVLNWFIKILMENKTVRLFGDGLQIRDVNFVDDVVEALIVSGKSRKADGKAYNLGGVPTTLLEFVKAVIEYMGKGKYQFVKFPKERESIEVGNYVAGIEKIERDLGWRPKTSLKDGVLSTVDYYHKYKRYYF